MINHIKLCKGGRSDETIMECDVCKTMQSKANFSRHRRGCVRRLGEGEQQQVYDPGGPQNQQVDYPDCGVPITKPNLSRHTNSAACMGG